MKLFHVIFVLSPGSTTVNEVILREAMKNYSLLKIELFLHSGPSAFF